MKLNITNTNAQCLHGQFGITEQRMNELIDHLDYLDNFYQGQEVHKSEVWNHIAMKCDTVEELIICVSVHEAHYQQYYAPHEKEHHEKH